MKILPPGAMDYFRIRGTPYRIELMLAADEAIRRERKPGMNYALSQPRYRVRVFRDRTLVMERETVDGIVIDGLTVRFSAPSYWVRLEIVHDPGLLPMAAGVLSLLGGLALKAASALSNIPGKPRGRTA
jgi:hypothetical protein